MNFLRSIYKLNPIFNYRFNCQFKHSSEFSIFITSLSNFLYNIPTTNHDGHWSLLVNTPQIYFPNIRVLNKRLKLHLKISTFSLHGKIWIINL